MVCIMHLLKIVIGILAALYEGMVVVEVELPMVLPVMNTTLITQWRM